MVDPSRVVYFQESKIQNQGRDVDSPFSHHDFPNLFRYRLEKTLGYRRTLKIEVGNANGAPVYTMVFARDSDAGVRIMSHMYGQALEQSAEYRAKLISRRDRQQREQAGTPNLFDNAGVSLPEKPRYFESIRDDKSPTLPIWLKTEL